MWYCVSDVVCATSHEAKMSSLAPPDACFFTSAYHRDGMWYFDHVQVVLAVLNVPFRQRVRPRPCDSKDDDERGLSIVLRSSARTSHEVLRSVCSSRFGDECTFHMKDLVVKLTKIESLSKCRVDGQPFGQLTHWSRVLEHAGAPMGKIVVFSTVHNQFYSVSAKEANTQAVNMRSALCWLRTKAGLGYSFGGRKGGVFSIQVYRRRKGLITDDACPVEDLQRLVSAIMAVFPTSRFD